MPGAVDSAARACGRLRIQRLCLPLSDPVVRDSRAIISPVFSTKDATRCGGLASLTLGAVAERRSSPAGRRRSSVTVFRAVAVKEDQ